SPVSSTTGTSASATGVPIGPPPSVIERPLRARPTELRTAATTPEDAGEELEWLHVRRQRVGLTDAEAEAASALTRQYERTVLVRAEAAALLAQRGRDVSRILGKA